MTITKRQKAKRLRARVRARKPAASTAHRYGRGHLDDLKDRAMRQSEATSIGETFADDDDTSGADGGGWGDS